jgi:hypothetical protein
MAGPASDPYLSGHTPSELNIKQIASIIYVIYPTRLAISIKIVQTMPVEISVFRLSFEMSFDRQVILKKGSFREILIGVIDW